MGLPGAMRVGNGIDAQILMKRKVGMEIRGSNWGIIGAEKEDGYDMTQHVVLPH